MVSSTARGAQVEQIPVAVYCAFAGSPGRTRAVRVAFEVAGYDNKSVFCPGYPQGIDLALVQSFCHAELTTVRRSVSTGPRIAAAHLRANYPLRPPWSSPDPTGPGPIFPSAGGSSRDFSGTRSASEVPDSPVKPSLSRFSI